MELERQTMVDLLAKYAGSTISPQQLAQLQSYAGTHPTLRRQYVELQDFDSWWEDFWYQHDVDMETGWEHLQIKLGPPRP